MKKKILKIVGVILLLFIGLIIAAPFILEAKIGEILRNNVNNNVNATLDFTEAKLSLISSFPSVEVKLSGVSLINKSPFEGDTLFAADQVDLKMGIGELFKGKGDALGIKNLSLDGANIYVKVNEDEVANYEIAKEPSGQESTTESSDGFSLDLQSYEITNSKVIYDDRATKVYLVVSDIQHSGKGDLSAVTSELDTHTKALVSFELDGTNYLNKNSVKLDALIGIDLKEDKYTFLKNEALVNQLPLVFDGFVKVNEDNQEIDISFKTPSSDFKNFLALIPENYASSVQGVKTTGECVVTGEFKGIVDEDHIPQFKIDIKSDNASFKYPDLPKTVKNIFLDLNLNNTTGLSKDTYATIKKASFMIDGDRFNLVSKITDLMGNPKVSAELKGLLNLANLSKAYPIPGDMKLSGILNADIATSFDMASIEKEQYQNTKTSGKLNLKDFEYDSSEMKNPVNISSTAMTFNPATVTLNDLSGTTGQTDFSASGTLDNFLGFMFNNENVEGDFNLKSNTFVVNDFMMEDIGSEEGENPTNKEQLKIPAFLDCNINATAAIVIYDNLKLKDVKGNLKIANESAILENMTSSLFNGKVSFNGNVSTKSDTPSFEMKLGMDQLGIGESFKSLELFEVLAPIAGALRGKLNSDIELSGNLNADFTPNLNTVTGIALAELLSTELNADQAKVLSSLASKLDFIQMDKLDLKGLKTALSFENGKVKVKPFDIKYEDMVINVSGSHTFDKKMSYKATMNVPTKYLGQEVNNLIAKIDEKELDGLTIPVTANFGGDYSNPQVSTDLASGIKSLTTKLIDVQKQKLINKGKDKATDLLENVFNGNSKENDSTSTTEENSTKGAVKDVLGGLLGGSKESTDSTKTKVDTLSQENKDPVKEAAKGILGGFLGSKKKKDTTTSNKDSIN